MRRAHAPWRTWRYPRAEEKRTARVACKCVAMCASGGDEVRAARPTPEVYDSKFLATGNKNPCQPGILRSMRQIYRANRASAGVAGRRRTLTAFGRAIASLAAHRAAWATR